MLHLIFFLLQGYERKKEKRYTLWNQVSAEYATRRSDKLNGKEAWIIRTEGEEAPIFTKKAQLFPP